MNTPNDHAWPSLIKQGWQSKPWRAPLMSLHQNTSIHYRSNAPLTSVSCPLSLWDKGFYLSHTKSIKKNTIQSLFLSRQDSQSLSIFSHPRSPAFMVSSCSVGQSQCVPCRVCVCLPAKNTICSSLCGVKFIGMSTSMKPTQKREKWRNWHRNWFFSCLLIGVCQLANKMDEASGSVKAFNRNDEQFLEAFAIFCGLGIQNTQMYETVERAMAKQEVTLEVRDFLRFFLYPHAQTHRIQHQRLT